MKKHTNLLLMTVFLCQMNTSFAEDLGQMPGKYLYQALEENQIEYQPLLNELIFRANSEDPAENVLAIIALGHLGHPAACETLTNLLYSNKNETVLAATNALGLIGSLNTVEALEDTMSHSNTSIARAAASARAALYPPATEEELSMMLLDAKQSVAMRAYACWELGKKEHLNEASEASLKLLSQDNSAEVRYAAAEALSVHGFGLGTQILIEGLQDPQDTWRIKCAKALRLSLDFRDHNDTALAALRNCLQDASVKVREAAVETLGLYEDKHASIDIRRLAEADGTQNLSIYIQALCRIGEADYIDTVKSLVDPRNENYSEIAMIIAKDTHQSTRTRIGILAPHMDDFFFETRIQTLQALSKIQDNTAIDLIAEALYDLESRVQETAAIALGKTANPKAVDYLEDYLENANGSLRIALLRGLGYATGNSAYQSIQPFLSHENVDVRIEACLALSRHDNPDSVAILTDKLHDSNIRVQRTAIVCLGQQTTAKYSNQVQTTLISLLDDENLETAAGTALYYLGQQAQLSTCQYLSDIPEKLRQARQASLVMYCWNRTMLFEAGETYRAENMEWLENTGVWAGD